MLKSLLNDSFKQPCPSARNESLFSLVLGYVSTSIGFYIVLWFFRKDGILGGYSPFYHMWFLWKSSLVGILASLRYPSFSSENWKVCSVMFKRGLVWFYAWRLGKMAYFLNYHSLRLPWKIKTKLKISSKFWTGKLRSPILSIFPSMFVLP